MAAPLTAEERAKLGVVLGGWVAPAQPAPAAAPVEIAPVVTPMAEVKLPPKTATGIPMGFAAPKPAMAAPAPAPAPTHVAPTPAAAPVAAAPAEPVAVPPQAAAVPVAAPTSLGPPKPASFADKKAAVLIPGEEALQQDIHEAETEDAIWEDTKRDARIKGQAEAAALFEEGVAQQEELLAQQQEKDAQFAAWAANDHAKRQALADEVAAAKVDPARFWKGEEGIGRAIMAGVAGVFGVLGAPATGGRNFAVEEINKAIERDINGQIADNEAKRAGLAAKQNEYTMRVKMFGDERAARASYMADAYRLVAKKIEAVAQKTGNEEQKLEAARLSDYFDNKSKIAEDQFRLSIEQKWAARQAAIAQAAAAAGAAAASKADKYRDKIMDAEIEGAKTVLKEYPGAQLVVENNHVVIVDPTSGKRIWSGSSAGGGKPGETTTVNIPVAQPGGGIAFQPTVVSKTGSSEVAKQAGGYAKAIQSIDRMQEAVAMDGPWTGKKKIAYEAALADYISNYAVAKGMGAVSDDEGKRIAKTTVPTPTWGVGYMSGAEKEQLEAQKKALSAEAGGLATAYGTPGTAGPAPITTVGAPVKK